MSDLSKRIAALPPEMRDLLLQQLMQEDGNQSPSDTIPLVSREKNTFPLSFSQQRMWLLDQLEPGNPAYNISGAIRLTGCLDIRALEQSLTEIVRRHETLRTTFSMVEEQPVQVIHPPMPFPLFVIDLSDSPEEPREEQLKKLVTEEASRPFDLSAGPLIRATIYKLSETDHVLAMVSHHIISDGWSSSTMIKELRTLYPAFVRGLTPQLPELAVQYVDYAQWQRKLIEDGQLEHQLTYWKQQLSGELPGLVLPYDHPRPETHTYHGTTLSLELPKSLIEKLEALSQRDGSTLFMTLLSAFNILLYRYSGQEDVIVVSPIANRNRLEIENLIGCFINTLAFRTDLSGNPSFRELLHRVHQVTMAAYENQDLPIEIPMEHIRPMRIHDQNLLFQVAFIYQNYPKVEIELDDLKLSPWEIEQQDSALDLSLYLTEENSGLSAVAEYNSDLFEKSTIQRILMHYKTLLEGITANPEQTISTLPILTSAEKQQMLLEWNATYVDFPKNSCFPELFEAQVRRTPDRIAVACNGKHLTYDQLNRQANQLAHLLVEQKVGPDVVVALLDYRGIDLLTAILAVFKAGGAYLPLDPYHPPDRIRQVLLQSKSPLVIYASEFEAKVEEAVTNWSELDRPHLLTFQAIWSQQRSEDNLSPRSSPTDLAYVIFTSGSTGMPKGAMVEQRGMINHLYAKISALNLSIDDRIAETASQCFDISVWQFLVMLILGGQVHIYSDELTHDPDQLLECIEWDKISILETVPTMMRAMLDAVIKNESARLGLSALRWFIPTGEALPPDLSRQWFEYFPDVPLLNAYGPTECSDDVTHYPIYEAPSAKIINMPIGRPINNMKMYVLNKYLQPAPIGVPGELYVGGVGVGRGYLNDMQRTSEAFLTDPFSREPHARLYKTGDLVRYLPDGNLEFLGRVDFQVKIRGFRIELGEIEAVLGRHPEVSEVVVMARQDFSSDKQLVAYLVPQEGRSPSSQDLRGFLQKHLPDYMIPSYFVLLEAFPLNDNGKINRKALPAPDRASSEMESNYTAPRDEIEGTIAKIFAGVLHLERVSTDDNFFDLGGHSLSAAQVTSRIRQELHIQLPLRSLFEAPAVEELAKQIKAILRIQQDQLQAVSASDEREEFQL